MTPMEDDQERVVIAGAGPVGLALALGLARQGVRSLIFEQKPALSVHSKAVIVLTRTCEILYEWEVLNSFKQHGLWRESVEVVDPKSHPIFRMSFDSLKPESPTPGVCVLPQDETEKLLYEAAIATGLVEVRFGHTVQTFDETANGVKVGFVGPKGNDVIEGRFLCGCDGAHGSVRAGLGLALDGKTYKAHAVLVDVCVADERDKLPWPRADFSQPGINAMIRFANGRWRIILARPGETDEAPPTPEFVQSVVDRMLAPGPIEIVWASAFKIHCRNAAAFRKGRVLLLGDSAHLNSPAGGQGMNAGIQDAHNLAWKLAAILKGANEEKFLNSYDVERQHAIRNGVDVATNRLTTFGIFMPPWLRGIAFRIMRSLARKPRYATRIAKGLGMLNYRYGESDLIDSSGGFYLPDLELEPGLRLRAVGAANGFLMEWVEGQIKLNEQTWKLNLDAGVAAQGLGRWTVVRPDLVVAYTRDSEMDAKKALEAVAMPEG